MGNETVKSENIIELRHVMRQYDDNGFIAVHDFNLEVKRGEFVTFLGPSGCGKTTTLRMIAGFDIPTSGEILLNGKSITSLPPYERPINTVFQRYALFPHMNIYDNIAFGLRQKKVAKDVIDRKVKRMLSLVDLEGFEDRSVSTLSGGQQQRIAIARALVNEPEILLLDEPLGALDLQLRRQMQVELKRLQKQLGITFIYITHDQEEAVNMSDRIAVMRSGRFEQIGTPEEIYDAPMTRYVAQFIGRSTILTGTVTAVNGDTAVIEDENGRYPADASRARLTPGEACDLCVRTERMRVSREPVPGFSLPCTVKEARYAGGSVLTYVTMAGGAEAVATGEERMADAAQPGDTVYLCWNPAQAAVIGGASHGA